MPCRTRETAVEKAKADPPSLSPTAFLQGVPKDSGKGGAGGGGERIERAWEGMHGSGVVVLLVASTVYK